MAHTHGRLKAQAQKLTTPSPTHIEEVFSSWVNLPRNLGRPARQRLFSPLTHLLAVPLPSPLEDAVVQRDLADISRVARLRAGGDRLAQHRRLLQSPLEALDKRHTDNAQEGSKEIRG